MNQQRLARHQRRLRALRARVAGDFEGLRDAIREQASHPSALGHVRTHSADADMEGLDVDLIAGQTESGILQAIEDALQRIEARTYGICTECGKPIPEQRLLAIPYAPHCVACERGLEAPA